MDDLSGLELYESDKTLGKKWSELRRAWSLAYPNLNVLEEVRKAHAWEVANPARQKRNRPRFLSNWLGRAWDKSEERKILYGKPQDRFWEVREGMAILRGKEALERLREAEKASVEVASLGYDPMEEYRKRKEGLSK